MQPFCRYADALGTPGTGVHAYRIGGLAAADIFLTAGAAAVISRAAFPDSRALGFAGALFLLMLAAVVMHEAFGVNTRLNAFLFGRPWPGAGGCHPGEAGPDKSVPL